MSMRLFSMSVCQLSPTYDWLSNVAYWPAATTTVSAASNAMQSPGSTRAKVRTHMAIEIRSRGQTASFSGDVMHSPLQVYRPQWNSTFCLDQPQARASSLKGDAPIEPGPSQG
jgi:hypothetical protein